LKTRRGDLLGGVLVGVELLLAPVGQPAPLREEELLDHPDLQVAPHILNPRRACVAGGGLDLLPEKWILEIVRGD